MKIIALSLIAATSLVAAPRAIVFNFGGVMTGEPKREVVVHFIRESFQLSLGEFDRVNQEKRRAFEQGKMDAEFWVAYAEERGIGLPILLIFIS